MRSLRPLVPKHPRTPTLSVAPVLLVTVHLPGRRPGRRGHRTVRRPVESEPGPRRRSPDSIVCGSLAGGRASTGTSTSDASATPSEPSSRRDRHRVLSRVYRGMVPLTIGPVPTAVDPRAVTNGHRSNETAGPAWNPCGGGSTCKCKRQFHARPSSRPTYGPMDGPVLGIERT